MKLSTQERCKLIEMLSSVPVLHTSRGREIVLKNADLALLLPKIDLEGPASVFVSDLVHYLESFGRITADHEALGRFLNAIKNEVGVESQQFLDYMLVQYDMMVPDAKLTEKPEWKFQPSISEVTEAIVGENTLRSVAFLQQAITASRPVALVTVDNTRSGSGFLISQDLLLTNYHVIPEHTDLSQVTFRFNYQKDEHGKLEPYTEYTSSENRILAISHELDYTIVEIKDTPGIAFGALPVKSCRVKKEERVSIIQHPLGMPKQISLQNNFVQYVDESLIQYTTSTLPGSSGSPVFNEQWQVVALHHAGGMICEPATSRRYFRNEGILTSRILQDLHPDVRSRLA